MSEHNELKLYRVIPSYVEYLSNEQNGGDKRVQYVRAKEMRPFIGIVTVCNGQKYCIPLTRIKGKKRLSGKGGIKKGAIDYSPIYIDGKPVAGIQFSRMIPIPTNVLRNLDLKEHKHDLPSQKLDKKIRRQETEWIKNNKDVILNKARILYNLYISGQPFNRKDDCLNFPKLEKLCKEYEKKHLPCFTKKGTHM